MTTQTIKTDTNSYIAPLAYAFMFAFVGALLFATVGFDAFADVAGAINNVKSQATSIVQPLGTIAIITLGIAAMFGRITWTQALIVAIGIVLAATADTVYTSIVR